MNLKPRTGCLFAVLLLAGCGTAPAPVEEPVAAGDGLVWVLKQDGRTALWGPRNSEGVFVVSCDPADARIQFRHYGLASPAGVDTMHLEADGQSVEYPAQVEAADMADALLASTAATDPFLDHLRDASRLRVVAGADALAIRPSAATLGAVIDACRD